MKIVRIAIGIGMIIFGLVIYPYYVTYFVEPMDTLIRSMFPSLNIWQETWLSAMPLVVLLLILFFGLMTILGKVENKDV